MINLTQYLKENTYPGRGILIGKSENGEIATAYFIMGRSENSRNRIFLKTNDGVATTAFDESKLSDPSLVIYRPVRELFGNLIITNGDQTDTIASFLNQNQTFEAALLTRDYEPDPPIFTPRISGIINDNGFKLSILKKDNFSEASSRYFFEYPFSTGFGKLIHTYDGDGSPVPSFTGEPRSVAIKGGIESFTSLLWNSLNPENKVALYVRFGNEVKIVNKLGKIQI